MNDDVRTNLKAGIEYVRRTCGTVSPEREAEIEREVADRRAKMDAARPRLDKAIDDYWRITRGEGLVADLAMLHQPRHDHPADPVAHCEGCDVAGMEAEQPAWPCSTAATIASAHGVDLDGMALYDWR